MLHIYANQTNDITMKLTKVRTDEPEATATITIALKDNGVLVPGTDVIMSNLGGGEYYVKYPLLYLAKKRNYHLQVTVVVNLSTVIDEEYPVETL